MAKCPLYTLSPKLGFSSAGCLYVQGGCCRTLSYSSYSPVPSLHHSDHEPVPISSVCNVWLNFLLKNLCQSALVFHRHRKQNCFHPWSSLYISDNLYFTSGLSSLGLKPQLSQTSLASLCFLGLRL